MALQSRMHLARHHGVRPGCRVCPMDAPRTPAPARAKQQAPGGVPGTGRQIADISRAPGLISENRGDAAGSAPPTHAATGHRTYQTVDGSSLKLYVVRVFEASRQQNFKKSSVWRSARPKRSGNVGVRHVPTKQNDYGGSWCQNSSLKFWPPGTELCSTCGTRASLVHHFARPDRVLTPICVLNSS